MKHVAYITNANQYSGVGHRAHEIKLEIDKQFASEVKLASIRIDGVKGALFQENSPLAAVKPWPSVLGSKSINWIRLGKILAQQKQEHPYDIYHATNQTLIFLAKKLRPTVVTVHDLIEILEPQDRKALLVNKYLYSGITKADQVIAVSNFTKRQIQEYYGIPAERITVIPNGVSSQFHPIENFTNTLGYQELLRDLTLGDCHPIVLYVGSEHPRKNVPVALEAFAKLKEERPDAVFIKVGQPGIAAGREAVLNTIDTLGIRKAVRFVGYVSDEKLNQLYNLADVFIFPSLYEGFGLPPLQAMAAGTPVICSDATSLPEVVGSAAVKHHPEDTESFAKSLLEVTADKNLSLLLRQKGLERAKQFSWRKAAEKEMEVYKMVV